MRDVNPNEPAATAGDRPDVVGGTGNAPALQRLIHAHGGVLARYVGRLVPADLNRLIDPQDVVQDAYVEAFQRLTEFSPAQDDQAALRWLKTIARNRLIDLVRRHRAAKRDSRRTADEVRRGSVIMMLQDLAAHSRTPSRSAAGHEFVGVLRQVLGSLPADHRDAVHYRYVDGLSFKEAGARMQRTEDATRMLAARGLRALRARIGSMSQFA